jgi:hypothetical protein
MIPGISPLAIENINTRKMVYPFIFILKQKSRQQIPKLANKTALVIFIYTSVSSLT